MTEKVKEIFEKYKKEEIIIFAHADHDGICATTGLNYLFGDIETIFSQSFIPKEIPNFYHKKLFIICDLQLSENSILYLLRKGLDVINLDHHEIREIQNCKYYCLNPKKIYKKQFISSSGLIWRLFKPEKINWVLAIGSVGDLAIEDVMDLFENTSKTFPELISSIDTKSIYNSKIFELAQILLMAFDDPNKGLNLLKESIKENYNVLYNSELYESYLKKQKILDKFLEENKDKIIENKNFVIINSSNQPYAGSYSVKLNLNNQDNRVYIEYNNGRLFFRNYFGNEDVKKLAKLFSGGGSHSRAGGGFTKKSFIETTHLIKEYYSNRSQQTLFNFSDANV